VPRDEPDDTWVALSETPVQDRPRVHLDLYASDQAAEIDRLLGLGASHVDWQDYPERRGLRRPRGHRRRRFCVVAHG